MLKIEKFLGASGSPNQPRPLRQIDGAFSANTPRTPLPPSLQGGNRNPNGPYQPSSQPKRSK